MSNINNMTIEESTKILGDALQREYDGAIKVMKTMSKPGVSLTVEQRDRIRALYKSSDGSRTPDP